MRADSFSRKYRPWAVIFNQQASFTDYGLRTSKPTIDALRLVKDFIIRKGGSEKVSISKTLIRNGQNSRALYKAKLAEENLQKWEAAENAKRIEEDNQKATEIQEIDNDILMIKNGIKITKNQSKEEIWS